MFFINFYVVFNTNNKLAIYDDHYLTFSFNTAGKTVHVNVFLFHKYFENKNHVVISC